MKTQLRQETSGAPEDSAGILAKRIERENRRRAERRRSIVLVASLAVGGTLLLSVAGVAMAVRSSDTLGTDRAKDATVVAVPTQVPSVAPQPAPSEPTSTAPADSPGAIASSEPAKKPASKVKPLSKPRKKPKASESSQHYSIKIGDTGYTPSVVKATSGSPITLTVGKGEGCAAGFTLPSLGIEKDNSEGPVTFSVGRLKPGTYRFACAMDMVEGSLVVR
jgi:plastocyanin